MAIFVNVNFSTFWTSSFYSLNRRFFVLEYHKRHFPGLYCLKKKIGKMAIFGPKPWVNPFGKMSIFRLFELLVFLTYNGVFSFQNIIKDIFLAYIAEKRKGGKMAIFEPKPWENVNYDMILKKMSIFRFFKLLFFVAQNGVFSFQNIIKDIFLTYIAKKKSWRSGHFLTKTMG